MYPQFYDPSRVGTLYQPRMMDVLQEASKLESYGFQHDDSANNKLLIIDAQVDFVHVDGQLSVPGAVDDTQRTIEFIFRNVAKISDITLTLDTHLPMQIFSPAWWNTFSQEDGRVVDTGYAQPFTTVASSDLWATTRPAFNAEWSEHYVKTLEGQSKKQLMVWPYHTLLGTIGHAIDPSLYEAVAYWSFLTKRNPNFVTKGTVPLTEHYSAFEAEVPHPQIAQSGLNTHLLDSLRQSNRLLIMGQAKSHCVLESVTSIINFGVSGASELLRKLGIVIDTMSDVTGFDSQATYDQWVTDYGINIVNSNETL